MRETISDVDLDIAVEIETLADEVNEPKCLKMKKIVYFHISVKYFTNTIHKIHLPIVLSVFFSTDV